jgi:hypothetical protein
MVRGIMCHRREGEGKREREMQREYQSGTHPSMRNAFSTIMAPSHS